jgi:hypothetical protein
MPAKHSTARATPHQRTWKWSARVTQKSDSLDLTQRIFTKRDPVSILLHAKESLRPLYDRRTPTTRRKLRQKRG